MWAKGELIQQAFSEIGLSSYAFNVNPEDFETALRSLDSMMATWEAKGLRMGYSMPGSAEDSGVETASGLPDTVHEAVFLNLALRIAPGFGKVISQDTRLNAKAAYDAMLHGFAFPQAQSSRSMPLGAGNRGVRPNAFAPPSPTTLYANDDALIITTENP